MNAPDLALPLTAAAIGAGHTILGPDHWVPFIVLARTRGWRMRRTLLLTLLCGLGHVASSLVLAAIGIAAGWALTDLMAVESLRGNLAGWLLLGFGLVYLVWGLRRGFSSRLHEHRHLLRVPHAHEDAHEVLGAPDAAALAKRPATSWVLFLIFVFGPCEPLIPLLMLPAAHADLASGIWAASTFALATLTVMLAIVAAGASAAEKLRTLSFERWSHALAGAALLACGVAVKLGL